MNKAIYTRFSPLLVCVLITSAALAGEPAIHEEHVIKIKTSGAEVFEADLTELAIGESRSFVTDAGKAIDLIRTADGAEVYIDGELVDVGSARFSGDHDVLHREVKVECLSDAEGEVECDHDAAFFDDAGDGDVKFFSKKFEVACDGDENCEDMVWVHADGDFAYDYETLDDAAGDGHQVIVIRKHVEETHVED